MEAISVFLKIICCVLQIITFFRENQDDIKRAINKIKHPKLSILPSNVIRIKALFIHNKNLALLKLSNLADKVIASFYLQKMVLEKKLRTIYTKICIKILHH